MLAGADADRIVHAAEAWLDGILPPPAPSDIYGDGFAATADRRCACRPAGGRVRAKSASAGAMERADFLIVGGGVAGLSAAARLARHGRVVVLEGEDALGYHSSGRSVSFSHYGIGTDPVRALTAHSRPFFEPPLAQALPDPSISPTRPRFPCSTRSATAWPASPTRSAAVDAGGDGRAVPAAAHRPAARCAACSTRPGSSSTPTSSSRRSPARSAPPAARCSPAAASPPIEPGWTVRTEAGEAFAAPILVNAAGAWADRIAALAGVAPLGLAAQTPHDHRRRSARRDAPAGRSSTASPAISTCCPRRAGCSSRRSTRFPPSPATPSPRITTSPSPPTGSNIIRRSR